MVKHYKQIKVPEDLHTRIKTKASSQGKKITEFLDDLCPAPQNNDNKRRGGGFLDIGF